MPLTAKKTLGILFFGFGLVASSSILLSAQSHSAPKMAPQKSDSSGWKTGQLVIAPQFEWADNFSEGLAAARMEGEAGYIDKTGHFAISPRFNAALHFVDGLAAVCIKAYGEEKWGYIDQTGHFVINPQFDDAEDFVDGLARVRMGDYKTGKYGYIAR